jgi:hypothetical protein
LAGFEGGAVALAGFAVEDPEAAGARAVETAGEAAAAEALGTAEDAEDAEDAAGEAAGALTGAA